MAGNSCKFRREEKHQTRGISVQTSRWTGSTSIYRWGRGSRLLLLSTRVLLTLVLLIKPCGVINPCCVISCSDLQVSSRREGQKASTRWWLCLVLVLHGKTDLEGSRQEGEELAEGGLVQQILVRVLSLGRLFTGLLHTEQEESCNPTAADGDQAQLVTRSLRRTPPPRGAPQDLW